MVLTCDNPQEEWVSELKLWFDNDGQMYRSRYIPFLKNYARKKNVMGQNKVERVNKQLQ